MKSRSLVVAALFAALSAPTVGAELIAMGFEPGVDQEALDAYAMPSGETAVLSKRFIEEGKTGALKNKVVYELRLAKSRQALPLAEFTASDKPVVGPLTPIGNGVIVPVIRGGSQLELYRYDAGRPTLQRLTAAEQAAASMGSLSKVYAFADALLLVGSQGQLEYRGYDAREGTPLELPPDLRKMTVDDVLDAGSMLHIVGVAPAMVGSSVRALLVSFDKGALKKAPKVTALEVGRAEVIQSRFIRPARAKLAVSVLAHPSLRSPPSFSIVEAAGDGSRVVWQRELASPEDRRLVAAAAACRDAYAFARHVRVKQSPLLNIEWVKVSADGKQTPLTAAYADPQGIFGTIGIANGAPYPMSIVNFRRLEDTRRADGWHSWLGFRVDDLSKDIPCG